MAPQQSQHKFPPRPVPPPLGQALKVIEYEDLQPDQPRSAYEIRECKYVASFNLAQEISRTLIIPGKPPRWTPAKHAFGLTQDSLHKHRDPVSARFPEHPYDPVIKSIYQECAEFQPGSIDIVVAGRILDSLMSLSKKSNENFSLVSQVVGDTIFLTPRNMSPAETVHIIFGNGQAFLVRNTTWDEDCKDSSSHQRLITYTLGGMRLLVRFEVDGYIPSKVEGDQAVAGASVQDELNGDSALYNGADSVATRLGRQIPQTALIDIKTRSQRATSSDVLASQLPRLWARQISNLVLAYHAGGQFEAPAVEDVSSTVRQWQDDNRDNIARMIAAMKAIKDATECVDGSMVEVRGSEGGKLSFHEIAAVEQDGLQALCAEYRKVWSGSERSQPSQGGQLYDAWYSRSVIVFYLTVVPSTILSAL